MEITGTAVFTITKASKKELQQQEDVLAVEEPLQIQLQLNTATGRLDKNIAVTMRTPGNDAELAAGFLFTEGLILQKAQMENMITGENKVNIVLKENVIPVLQKSERNFYTTSSCGVCGKASIDAIKTVARFNDKVEFSVMADVLYSLQEQLIQQQQLFESTGGLHAAALFNVGGGLKLLREDVGRHNALDKIIGNAFLNEQLPLYSSILLLSGRASFELVQKAAMAGIKIIAAIGAPSNLAVELAIENNITLIGFLRQNKMNIYCGAERITV